MNELKYKGKIFTRYEVLGLDEKASYIENQGSFKKKIRLRMRTRHFHNK